MVLGIVGHEAAKFTERTKRLAFDAMREAIAFYRPSAISSGRCPLGGIDIWAEELASELSIPAAIFPPKVNQWGGAGGFKARNLRIAEMSDRVLVVSVAEFPVTYTGRRFRYCYHCKDLVPPHIKSGGCWTAWRCRAREWAIIGEAGFIVFGRDVTQGT